MAVNSFLFLFAICASSSISVTTSEGRLFGVEQDGVHVFLGVPFAAAPVGKLRWLPPQWPPRY
jgi:para-nitrobenzyl esterase